MPRVKLQRLLPVMGGESVQMEKVALERNERERERGESERDTKRG